MRLPTKMAKKHNHLTPIRRGCLQVPTYTEFELFLLCLHIYKIVVEPFANFITVRKSLVFGEPSRKT